MFFAIVENSFQIAGRGCVLVPAPSPLPDFRLRAEDPIRLQYPDGRTLETRIASIEMLSGPGAKGRLAFLLPEPITKSDIPSGTEIWLVTNSN
jgi:hypothetical protein